MRHFDGSNTFRTTFDAMVGSRTPPGAHPTRTRPPIGVVHTENLRTPHHIIQFLLSRYQSNQLFIAVIVQMKLTLYKEDEFSTLPPGGCGGGGGPSVDAMPPAKKAALLETTLEDGRSLRLTRSGPRFFVGVFEGTTRLRQVPILQTDTSDMVTARLNIPRAAADSIIAQLAEPAAAVEPAAAAAAAATMPSALPQPASSAAGGSSKRPRDEPEDDAAESSDGDDESLSATERKLTPFLRVRPSRRAHYAREAQHLSLEQWKLLVATEREPGLMVHHGMHRLLRWYKAYGPADPDDLAFVCARLPQINAVPGDEKDVLWRPGAAWCQRQCRACEESYAKWISEHGEAKLREWNRTGKIL